MFPNKDAGDASTVIGCLVLLTISLLRILNTIILVWREEKKKLSMRPTSGKKRIYCTKFHWAKKNAHRMCRNRSQTVEQENRLYIYGGQAV